MTTCTSSYRITTGSFVDFDTVCAEIEQLVMTDPSEAMTRATDAIGVVDREGNLHERIRMRRMLAMAYAHTNQFSEALAICREAEALPAAFEAQIEVARVQLASMQPLANLDRIDEAIAAGESAFQVLEDHEGGALAGRAAFNIGSIYAMTGRPAQALPFFERARALLPGEPVLLGQIETNRGTALAALDRFREAEEAFERAALLLTTDQMSWSAAIAEGNLADLAARQGAINRSLRHFEASRRRLERDDALGDLGRLNAEEAAVLATSGLTGVARDAFVQAIGLLNEHGTPADLAMARVAYGAALVGAGELSEAEELLGQVEGQIDDHEQPELALRFTALCARLAIARGDHDDAQQLIARGLQAVDGLPVQAARWSILQADLFRASGAIKDARSTLSQVLAIAEQTRVTPLIGELHQMLSELARESGSNDLADSHSRKAIDAFERIRGTIHADRLRQSFHHGRLALYGDLYLSLVGQDAPSAQAEAFGVAERIRSRMLLDAMNVKSSDVGTPDAISAAEQTLIDELADHRGWMNWMYSSLADGREPTDSQLNELDGRERAAAQLADRLATLRPKPGFDTPLALDRVQQYLDESDVLLSYLVVGDVLTVQVITSDNIAGREFLARDSDLADLIASLQFQIGRALVHGAVDASTARQARLKRDMDDVLARLYDLLIAPVASWLTSRRRLVIVPSGDLHGVPFAALRDGETYLIDRLAITTAPGMSILAGMREADPASTFRSERVLVAGVPDDAAPGLGDEAQRVGQRFPGARILLGEEATCEAVLAAMPTSQVVHLACHGRFDSDHPSASGLRLANGWLTLDRLVELRLDQPLVLLTGCETGRVRVEDCDDLVGMVAAMIAAGASGLVTSLWKTHDIAASALVSSLYDSLEAGADLVTALRSSQRSVREQFGHPAYWAPFVGVQAGERREES